MATEKATDTTATQNPAKASAKAPSKARTTRAQASNAASTTAPAAVNSAAPKKPRAKSTRSAKLASPASERSENAAAERSLLEKESAKSLSNTGALPPKAACKAHCGQCGREMRFVPFALSNLMCRSCYGLDRYRRPAAPSLSSLTASRPGGSR